MIIMDSVVIPKPPLAPPLPPPVLLSNNNAQNQLHSTNSSGFRLVDDQNDTGSIYSVYKQKIDSMFGSDTSVRVDAAPTTVPPATVPTKNCVQARIERMFTDVAKDTGVPINGSNVHIFSVDYLGSVQLGEKVTSLDGLQVPLKELYFSYKKKHIRTNRSILTGRLEISNLGLKVHYQGDKGDLEQMNSFPTIAVWSAVKFVMQQQQQQSGKKMLKFAFLPLITDPDNFDKANLFKELEENDRKFIRIEETHSPLFAVVMRKIGVQKQLECHGFVCQTSEDAIVIAATLYKSLMAHMKAKEMRPKNRNGITCMSIASTLNDKSSNMGGGVPVRPPRKKRSTTSSTISETDGLDTSDTQPLLQKAPKKSTKTRRAPKTPEDLDAILPYEEPNNGTQNSEDLKSTSEPIVEVKPKSFSDKISTYMSREQKQITAEIKQVMSGSTNRGLKHVPTLLRSSNNNQKDKNGNGCNNSPGGSPRKENSGDILTKVTIPRSGSFLNAGGLTRYKSKVSRGNGQMTGGSPLGFSELFNEFRLQEGLHSMDEILGVIIDPEGMSFNDLKPIYKEFLLKLSVTLTKDELYQRAKMIMRRQRKKALKRSTCSTNNPNASKTFVSNRFKRLKHIFQKKLKIRDKSSRKVRNDEIPPCKVPESTISTSSYDTRQFQPKKDFANGKAEKKSEYHRKKSADFRISTSEDSDFFSLRRKHKYRNGTNNQHRNSSSGYVSCSECSYDSDTCTCTSADKCYCSLGNDKNNNSTHLNKDGTLTYCGCDTDSCTDSNKCYCSKDRGSVLGSDGKKKKRYSDEYHHKHRKLCKKLSNSRSTRSLEYMHNPVEAYYEKLLQQKPVKSKSVENYARGSHRRRNLHSEMGIDYDLFNRNRQLYGNGSASVRSYGFHKHRTKDSMLPTTALDPDSCFEAMSVKKSAEIAALFADMKLSQTTDIKHLSQHNYDALNAIISSKNVYNRLKTQQSLVYSHQNGYQNPMPNQKMVQNTLYARNPVKNTSLYSAQNGLYTIQSQSDESRRSSLSDGASGRVKQKKKKSSKNFDYYELDSGNNLSNSLENSLGYLP